LAVGFAALAFPPFCPPSRPGSTAAAKPTLFQMVDTR